jgi:hypothetical protein
VQRIVAIALGSETHIANGFWSWQCGYRDESSTAGDLALYWIHGLAGGRGVATTAFQLNKDSNID